MLTRNRGDDYPITVNLSVNGEAVDFTQEPEASSVLKLSYKNADETVKTITGTPTEVLGDVEFIPSGGTDFQVVGVFDYDVQRVTDGYTFTHVHDKLIVDGDVTA